MKKRRVLGLVAGTLLVSGTVVHAGQEPAPDSTMVRRAAKFAARANLGGASASVLGAAAVRVVGVAWKSDNTPVAYPMLRIRNLQGGLVAARTTGTELGEFRFDNLPGGVYLIELLDIHSDILAVGQPLTVLPGETVSTFIRLSNAVIGGSPLFGGSAPALVQTAADASVRPIGGGYAASNEQ